MSYINNIMYAGEITEVSLNFLINTKDYKLLVLRRVIIMIMKLITYKSLNISLLELLLIL